ncbi:hypothetical protein [Amycolatopsis samaneae]|uniref:WXG100 family type VII secretion target n=1 Tax=Amycolatopsis samaneae TaxID=664691 RepID=A0ABW5GEU1_9PSEU
MGLAGVGSDNGYDLPSPAEVRQILDDPNVDRTAKQKLAADYNSFIVQADPQKCGFPDYGAMGDFSAYLGRYSAGAHSAPGKGVNDVKSAYKDAKEKYDRSRQGARDNDRKALNDDAARTQAIAGRATETDPGCANSKEIFDRGLSAFKVYEVFHPLYVAAVRAADAGGAVVSITELRRLYHEQDNIPFALFKAGADELAAVGAAVDNSSKDVAGKLRNSLGTWEGDAADQAREYQKAYSEKNKLVAEAFKAASEGQLRVLGSIARFCQDKVGWLQKWYTDKVGEATAQDIERIIRIADGSCSQNDIKHCIRFLSIDAKNAFNDDWGNLDQSTIDQVITPQAKKWLAEIFVAWFGKHIENFQLVCANTRNAVNGAWGKYFESLGNVAENPYADLGKQTGEGKKPETGGVRVTGGGEKNFGGGGDTGAQAEVGPMPKPPEMPKPPKPPELPKPPEAPAQDTNPVTHQPLEVDPGTGKPYPIDPRTGAALKSDVDKPETVTVQQGDHRISLAEPGQNGRMGIGVDNGAGHKDYELDFGDGKRHGPPEGPAGAVHHDTAARLAQQQQPEAAGQAYRPGPDGKIHIEDGNLKLTAERPDGPEGATVVTVDDGSGQPARYTLGEDGPADAVGRHPAAAGPGAQPDGPAQPAPRHEAPGVEHGRGDLADGAAGGRHPVVTDGGAGGGATDAAPAAPVPAASSADAGHAATASGEATTAQSISDLSDSHDGVGVRPDNGLGQTSDPAGTAGGGSGMPTETGLGSAPDGAQPMPASMGMLGGGMPGGGTGGGSAGGGEDQQRSSGGYRLDGGLFETAPTGDRISGSIDDDGVIGSR